MSFKVLMIMGVVAQISFTRRAQDVFPYTYEKIHICNTPMVVGWPDALRVCGGLGISHGCEEPC